MNQKDVNYRVLEYINHPWKTVPKLMFTSLWPLTWRLSAFILVLALGAGATHYTDLAFFLIGFWVLLMPLLISEYKTGAWKIFARDNHWKLDSVTPIEKVTPPSLNFGHNHNFSYVIHANIDGIACDLFMYECTTGKGKLKITRHFTVGITDLPVKSIPHIVLLTKKGIEAGLKNDISNGETLRLEGDFNKYFKLQIEKGQQIDALAVITPDVMETLIDYNQSESIEIFEGKLYFIVRGDKRGATSVKQLIRSITELGGRLQRNVALSHYDP
jgi:hypothetical protein